jgi:hypothetical protein
MELEAINNPKKYGYIYNIKIMNYDYIGSGEDANNKNRLKTHLYELFNKINNREPITRKLFKAINEFILNIAIFYTNMSFHDFFEAVRRNPNLYFTTIKDNVAYTTLKELKKEEQLSIDEYNSIKSPFGLNCVRAYRFPELAYDYKKESDMQLLKTNPINRVFRKYISDNQTYFCELVGIKNIKHNTHTKHIFKKQQIDMIIDNLLDCDMYWKAFIKFLIAKEKSIWYGFQIITDDNINKFITSLHDTNLQCTINRCYYIFKTMK